MNVCGFVKGEKELFCNMNVCGLCKGEGYKLSPKRKKKKKKKKSKKKKNYEYAYINLFFFQKFRYNFIIKLIKFIILIRLDIFN